MAEKKYMSLERLQEYDALVKQEIDGKADSGHTHKYAGSSSAGGAATSANKVNSSLTVKLNGGSTEGTNLFTFNGSAAKSVNITPSAIGAAASSHNHDDRYYTESEIDDKISTLNTAISGKSDSGHTHSISNVTNLQTTLDGKVPTTRTVNGKALSADITLTASDVGASASGHTHSAYVNQNAFSNVTVGDTTIAADSTTDTLTIAAGTGISVSADATNYKVTITNSGVRSISTGSSNGTISVNTNGSSANVAVKGLGSAAYTASTAYDAAGTATTKADAALASAKSYTDTEVAKKADKTHNHDTIYYGKTDGETLADTLAEVKEDVDNFFKDADLTSSAKDTLAELQAYISSDETAASEMLASINGKADKATTLSGYGITNAYTKTEVDNALSGKAASSHGTHVSFDSTNKPKMDGTAAFGTSSKVARADHVHPTDTSRAAKTALDSHTGDTTVHITSTERTNWGTAYTHSQAAHAPSNAQANQNAFSNIAVSGQTTVAADTTTDTVTFVGSNVSITTDATNDKVTFSVADGTTGAKGVVQLTNATNSTSTTTAATPNSVKSAYDLADTAKTNAATAQTKADSAYTLAEGKVDSLSDLGITATATELNYVDGVTSGIQAQLDGKAASSHTHTIANVTNLQTTLDGKAPTSHASSATTYGIGTSSNYGHVKLSDATNSTSSTSAGIAATPAAVKAAYDLANGKANSSHNHSGSEITSGTVAAARLPVASNSASGIVNTSSQTFAGAKTFSGVITASSGITTGGSIISDTANTDDIGSGSIPFDVTYTRTLNVSPKSVSGSIILGGSFGTTTEGTTTTNGFTELKVGNAKASGTDGNSQGLVQLYNSSTGSVTLQCGHSTSSDYRVYLPSGGGTLALNSTFVKSGSGAKDGLVPAPSTTAGTTKYLREDGTWAVPPDTNTTYTLSSFGITATAAELNYCDGVTSAIQTQLNGKAASSHNHAASNITSGTLSSDRLPTVPVAKGGTGATTAAAARTNLGLATENWTFTLEDGSTVTKAVYIG